MSVTWLVCIGFGLNAILSPWSARAATQDYPNKPVRLLVGFAPGGNVDIIARLISQKLTQSMGQSVVVDNRSGAGGIIAAETVAKAPPDGYTLLVASAGHAVNSALYRKLPYDAIKDFTPISIVSIAPHVLVVNSALPIGSVKDLISLARGKPGYVAYGSGGLGSLTHLEGEYLKSATGIDIVHVPYKGVSQALNDLSAGQVQLVFTSSVSALPFVKAGRVKIIATTGSKRLSFAPEIPTVVESGIPQFVVDSVTGLLAPAGTPDAVVNKLNAEVVRFLKTAEMQSVMTSQGAEAIGSSPRQYMMRMVEELSRWKKVVTDARLPVQDNW